MRKYTNEVSITHFIQVFDLYFVAQVLKDSYCVDQDAKIALYKYKITPNSEQSHRNTRYIAITISELVSKLPRGLKNSIRALEST